MAWKAVCQQLLLLAVLSMLFLALPLCASGVARELLSRGVAFSGLDMAVVAPEGENTGELIAELTGKMPDVRAYATITAMPYDRAMEALEEGSVCAVLVLPERFVEGILDGTNPDVTVITHPNRPLEGLLALWAGQSAADLLAASQRGIYAVLERIPQSGTALGSWDQALININLRYINLTLNRQDMFTSVAIQATDLPDSGQYYGFSMLIFLALLLPPVFCAVFDPRQFAMGRRLQAMGIPALTRYGALVIVIWGACFGVILLPALLLGAGIAGVAVMALFCTLYAGVCCGAFSSVSSCAGVSMRP